MKTSCLYGGKLALAGLVAGCLVASTANLARAGLGENDASVETDAATMRGKMAEPSKLAPRQESDETTPYTVRSFVTDNGVTVREYVANSGPIFGVAWQGRRPPDLSVLLGSYYPEYSAASASKEAVNLHHERIEGPHSVVMLSGRMGHLVGRAYVPRLAPAGVDAEAVVK
jgi:hypothetical protein